MKLLLLTRQRTGYTATRLAAAARALGHRLRVLGPGSLAPGLHGTRVQVLRRGRLLDGVDGVHWRPDGDVLDAGLMVLAGLEQQGAVPFNRAESLRRLRPRGLALTWLAGAGVPVLPAVVLRRVTQLEQAVERVGGLPVVLRAEDRQGRACSVGGNTLGALRAAVDVLLSSGQVVLVQAGARESTRVLVVDGRARAALRVNRAGQLEALQGRAARPVRHLAEAAAAALDLEVVGVDLAWRDGSPAVEGLTASPALEALEALCRPDLAQALVRAWVRKVRAARLPVPGLPAAPARL